MWRATQVTWLANWRSGWLSVAAYAEHVTEATGERPAYQPRVNLPQARIGMARSLQGWWAPSPT